MLIWSFNQHLPFTIFLHCIVHCVLYRSAINQSQQEEWSFYERLKLDSTIDPYKDTGNPFESYYSCLKIVTLKFKKYCSRVCHKILMSEGRTMKLQIQQVLKKTIKNPWNQNTYYHKKKHTQKHWKKERNKRTTCEATTGANVPVLLGVYQNTWKKLWWPLQVKESLACCETYIFKR